MSDTAVIVQARMGSTRLPGKVLRPLAGHTALSRVLERCRAIPGADVVVCCVPEGPADDPVAAEAARSGAVVTRGPERDVLARYLIAARHVGARTILRVTSDCPLLDPALAGEVIALYQSKRADLACNDLLPLFPHGLGCEAFSLAWLERAEREAATDYDHEHVSTFIYHHPQASVWHLMGPGGALARHRWTLDTLEDLALLDKVAARLPSGPAGWPWRETLRVVEGDPDLARDSARARYPRGHRMGVTRPILVVTAAGHEWGMGHAVRTSALVAAMGAATRVRVLAVGAEVPLRASFPAARLSVTTEGGLERELAAETPALAVVDLPPRIARPWAALRRLGAPVAAVEDFGGEVDADVVFNGSVVECHHLFRGPSHLQVYAGGSYALIRPDFAAHPWVPPPNGY
ncbi:MAG: glycosyltransferase family protein [Magnetospirillum sp.]|nr:glycosyltransferase family protein [Magnetospirillum sp.]